MHRSVPVTLALTMAAGTLAGCTPPSLEGTYMLAQRRFPDGTTITSPDIVGSMSFEGGHRSFNLCWRTPEGKRLSISSVAEYRLRNGSYTEHSEFYVINDEIGGGGLSYELSRPHGSSPVQVRDGHYAFQLPLFGEPAVVFDGEGFTATRPGGFVDRWRRVD